MSPPKERTVNGRAAIAAIGTVIVLMVVIVVATSVIPTGTGSPPNGATRDRLEQLEQIAEDQVETAELLAEVKASDARQRYLLCQILTQTETYDGPAAPCIDDDGEPLTWPGE